MKTYALVMLFVVVPVTVHAFVPNIVVQTSLEDVTAIGDPALSQTFYAELAGFPHTYLVTLHEPLILSLRLHAPENSADTYTISGIIVKEEEGSGRVTEIARLSAQDAGWEAMTDAHTGDTYRSGPVFERELEAGAYRIEVHTPDNLEKYIMQIGTKEERTIGYVELIRRLAAVKLFFEKSQFRIIESPYVYAPLLSAATILMLLWYLWRRMQPTKVSPVR